MGVPDVAAHDKAHAALRQTSSSGDVNSSTKALVLLLSYIWTRLSSDNQ
jgi:hypothetical protein